MNIISSYGEANMKKLFSILFINLELCCFAQSSEKKLFCLVPMFNSDEQEIIQYVIDNNVNIRSLPSKDGKVLAKLNIGEKIKIVECMYNDILYVDGLYAPWYKVQFQKENEWLTGYMCGKYICGDSQKADIDFDNENEIIFWYCYTDNEKFNVTDPFPSYYIEGYAYIKNGIVKPITGIESKKDKYLSGITKHEYFKIIDSVYGLIPRVLFFVHGYGKKYEMYQTFESDLYYRTAINEMNKIITFDVGSSENGSTTYKIISKENDPKLKSDQFRIDIIENENRKSILFQYENDRYVKL
jgi:hypothetical protein